MNKELVIVFVKNIKLGKVKTRLAKTIGNQGAFEVYKELVKVTENATTSLLANKHIYFSESVVENQWKDHDKFVQNGIDLGERMKNAFKKGFEDGYEHIVLIGSDLPDIHSKHIENALNALKNNEVVFGPALDGGYYLIGLNKTHDFIFENKPWSQSNLLEITIEEIVQKKTTYLLLETLNDIDTFEDLQTSSFYRSNIKLQEKIKTIKIS